MARKAGKQNGRSGPGAARKPERPGTADRPRAEDGGSPPAAQPSLRPLLRVPTGAGEARGGVRLGAFPTSAIPAGPAGKEAAAAATAALAKPLAALQERLYAASTAGDRRRLLLVLQGMDTSGKGGTVKHVIGRLNPSGCRITAFKAPTTEESEHPFLWRVMNALPHPGEIGIFDRSHYEDVLIARVHGLVPPNRLERRYAEINLFEQSLADDGVTLVKVFLHIGYEEQRKRLLARLADPAKHWKFAVGDIDERALWPAYQRAYELALERCSTGAAPWYVVPADHKWYRNWAVGKLLLEHLEDMDPRYPEGGFDTEECRIRLMNT